MSKIEIVITEPIDGKIGKEIIIPDQIDRNNSDLESFKTPVDIKTSVEIDIKEAGDGAKE